MAFAVDNLSSADEQWASLFIILPSSTSCTMSNAKASEDHCKAFLELAASQEVASHLNRLFKPGLASQTHIVINHVL